MAKSNIKEAVIAVTYKCNSRCTMCDIWKRKDHAGELEPVELYSLPQNIKDINITGGEPFLRQDLAEIVKVLNYSHPKASIIISTNGFATELIRKSIREILTIKPSIGVAVSLDGIGEAHNKIRGVENGYVLAMKTLAALKAEGVKNLKIGFTLGDYNIPELKKVYRLSRELGVELTISAVHSSENYFGKENQIAEKEAIIKELTWLMKKELSSLQPKRWARAYFTYGLIEFIKTGRRLLPDFSGELNIFVDPRGNIYPSDVSTRVLGNIRSSDNINYSKQENPEASWMICTARQAIKKHKFRVVGWIIKNKIINSVSGKY